ncbi:MAG TPA: FdhF/YdeP family oxidoreductase [Blastocatellia bacterium]|nr:FdhF/YdeP family oxidoreductase [Blastocatellia bacterium]
MNEKDPNQTGCGDVIEARAQPPEETAGTTVSPRAKSAAGLPSILRTMDVSLKEMGVGRSLKTLLQVNQKDGFDCQSCAWPNPDGDRHRAEFCESGAKAVAHEATRKLITPEFFRQWSVSQLAEQSDHWLEQRGRLSHPVVLQRGATHYEPITWDGAFALIAEELSQLDSPDEAAFYTSGRTSNEAAFLYQLFARQFGTNNLPDCSNMCHESSGVAMRESIGVGKTTVTLEDFELADLILIIGQNPGTNHPRMLTTLERAKMNGARIISINPLPEAGLMRFRNPNPQEYKSALQFLPGLLGKGTELSDLFLPVRINGDIAALKGLMKTMLEDEERNSGLRVEEILDYRFIRTCTAGFDEFKADLKATTWGEIEEGSGLKRDLIQQAGLMIAGAKRLICCWAMGLTQHRNAVGTIQTLMNLMLAGGHVGRPGAGPCCVRGHSNVQGDRTMGIWEKPSDAFLGALGREFNFNPPRRHGCNTVEAIRAMHEGRVKVFFALGGNFLSAAPDTEYTAQALSRCRLTAHVSTKLNRAHLICGEQALILPTLGRTEKDVQASGEQFVTVEDSMCVVSPSRGPLEPASEHLLSEPAIVARLARAVLGERASVDWQSLAADYDRIRDHISRVVPGFENFNERIRRGAFYLPNAAREREFNTPTGRANFIVHPIPRHHLEPGQFLMMTIRSHDQFNTTIYGLDDRYRGIRRGRRVIFLNREDVKEAGLQAGQLVDLTSHFEDEQRTARHFIVVPYDIPRRCAATYFPEANVLVPVGSVAEKSNTPTSKSVVISLTPSDFQGMIKAQSGTKGVLP